MWNDDGTATLAPRVAEVYQRGDTVLDEDQIRAPRFDALADEARRMLDEVSWPRPRTSTYA